jgi:2-phospho-L-lactate guanylyltransferase
MLGIERALALGIERALCVPGDCPALDPGELAQLLGVVENQPEAVIVPDRHGTGTNGLLLTPADAIAPSFGADSCERHRMLAFSAGITCRVERPSSLLLDIDTGEDLAALRARLSGELVRAPRTRAALGLPVRKQALPTTAPA